MASELETLRGWVRPYPLLEHAVVVLAHGLGYPVKSALFVSGPELPIKVLFEEPEGCEDVCTHRIRVEPDGEDDDSVRVVLRAPGSDSVQAERTVRWDGDPSRTDRLIGAIRELAGLDTLDTPGG
ncbi:MAG: hypothetical protein JNK45_00375 [Myxococcales bacterium]|jgi:hypothetical protein|nr:hypothetical protein [Myxococcales bacterium]